MTMCVKSIARTSFNLLSKNVFQQLTITATRQLYSVISLGINGYLNTRDYVKSQFMNVDHLFFKKMKDFVEKPDAMIFTEDLKTMMHLVEKKPELLELMCKMMQKYNSQNNLRFGSFAFGTVAMRALYHLDEPDLALKVFKDPQMENFFDQIMTHQILMDLLYNHGKYADVREVYDIIKCKNINGIVHPKNPFIIVMGSCYKENTRESFDYAVQLFKEAQMRGYEFPRRAITFLSALALKQNDPHTALEVVSLVRKSRYIDIRCLKIESYTLLKRFDEVMIYFRNTLQEDGLTQHKQCYFKDTFEKVEAAILEENFDENSEIMKMLKQIKLHDYVQPTLLEEYITSMIDHIKYNKTDPKPWEKAEFRNRSLQRNYSDRFTKQGNFEGDNSYNRPALRDIV